jgi:hypothetical protein
MSWQQLQVCCCDQEVACALCCRLCNADVHQRHLLLEVALRADVWTGVLLAGQRWFWPQDVVLLMELLSLRTEAASLAVLWSLVMMP